MQNILLVGTGGLIGSIARYALGGVVTQWTGASRFPAGTLAVNTIGCLVIGLLAGAAESGSFLSPQMRLLLFTGVLGGFTTFSAFGYETFFLVRSSAWPAALLNVALHLVIALPCVWIGHAAGSALAR